MQRNKDEHIKYNLNSTVLFDGLRYSLGGNGLYKEPNLRYPIIELNDNELDFVGNYGIKSFLVWKEFDNSEKEEFEKEINMSIERIVRKYESENKEITDNRLYWVKVQMVERYCYDEESTIIDRLKEAEKKRQKEYEKEREEYEIKREIKRQEEEARKEKSRFNQRNRHCLDCKISFRESDHIYVVNGVCLDSVTTFVGNCFPKFDMKFHAKRKAEAMRVPVQEVIEMWEQKGKESRDLGVKMHQNIEDYYQDNFFIEDDTFRLFKIFACNIRLEPYRTEWAVYDWEYKIAGTIDFIDYQNGKYTIYDWKRSDKIITNGIPIKKDKYGEKANFPLEHLDNSPYYHYALQLSLYKFILERNYNIKISSLRLGLFHPTYIKPYLLEMPYLENEINTIFNLRSEVIF